MPDGIVGARTWIRTFTNALIRKLDEIKVKIKYLVANILLDGVISLIGLRGALPS